MSSCSIHASKLTASSYAPPYHSARHPRHLPSSLFRSRNLRMHRLPALPSKAPLRLPAMLQRRQTHSSVLAAGRHPQSHRPAKVWESAFPPFTRLALVFPLPKAPLLPSGRLVAVLIRTSTPYPVATSEVTRTQVFVLISAPLSRHPRSDQAFHEWKNRRRVKKRKTSTMKTSLATLLLFWVSGAHPAIRADPAVAARTMKDKETHLESLAFHHHTFVHKQWAMTCQACRHRLPRQMAVTAKVAHQPLLQALQQVVQTAFFLPVGPLAPSSSCLSVVALR